MLSSTSSKGRARSRSSSAQGARACDCARSRARPRRPARRIKRKAAPQCNVHHPHADRRRSDWAARQPVTRSSCLVEPEILSTVRWLSKGVGRRHDFATLYVIRTSACRAGSAMQGRRPYPPPVSSPALAVATTAKTTARANPPVPGRGPRGFFAGARGLGIGERPHAANGRCPAKACTSPARRGSLHFGPLSIKQEPRIRPSEAFDADGASTGTQRAITAAPPW